MPTAVVALTAGGDLLKMDADNPGVILDAQTVTGLDDGESLVALDGRPGTAQLYGLSNLGRLYTLNVSTGAAAAGPLLVADPADATDPYTALSGTNFDIDFNPLTDRLRVVSDSGINLDVDPDSGLVITDAPLTFATGDIHFGATPFVTSIAYTSEGKLYALDGVQHVLIEIKPVEGGILSSVNGTCPGPMVYLGFDIGPDGRSLSASVLAGHNPAGIYALTRIDPWANWADEESLGYIGDGQIAIVSFAILPSTVTFSRELHAVNEASGSAVITIVREGYTNLPLTIAYSAQPMSAESGSDFLPAAGTVTFAPGQTTAAIAVLLVKDQMPEADEFFSILLSDPTDGAAIGVHGSTLVRINADASNNKGPKIIAFGLTGPSRSISGMVLTFDKSLARAAAERIGNYKLIGVTANDARRAIKFVSAKYDPVLRTVTLKAAKNFKQTNFKQFHVHVLAGKSGIRDVFGKRIDGNADGRGSEAARMLFRVVHGNSIRVTERDGDVLEFGYANDADGQIDALVPVKAPKWLGIQFWISQFKSNQAVFTSRLTPSAKGDGIGLIAEIIGLDHGDVLSITDSSLFKVSRLTFSSDATGLL